MTIEAPRPDDLFAMGADVVSFPIPDETAEETEFASYDSAKDLTLDEVSDIMRGVFEVLDDVRAKYVDEEGNIAASAIADEDNEAIAELFGVVLPVGYADSVQAQARSDIDPQEMVISQMGTWQVEAAEFLARFENTGVKVYYGAPLFD